MRQTVSITFLLLTLLFCTCLIVSNLMEIKTIDLGPLTITAGVIVFPLSYIINDCIVEVYGFARARLVIWLGFAVSLLVTILLQICLWLPGNADWSGQEAMQTVFGATPRILCASFLAFISGSMVNAWIMDRMKKRAGSSRFSMRAIVSTLWGEGVDSLIFFPLAFGGVISWDAITGLIITQTLLKTGYETAILPVTIAVVKRLRKMESVTELSQNVA